MSNLKASPAQRLSADLDNLLTMGPKVFSNLETVSPQETQQAILDHFNDQMALLTQQASELYTLKHGDNEELMKISASNAPSNIKSAS